MTRRDTRLAKVSVVAAIEVAVLKPSGTENNGRVATTMMRLPTTSTWVSAATIPDKLLAATFAAATCPDPSLLYFFWGEFIIVRHHSTPYSMLNREF
jgi:hypothetical protein